MSSRTVPTQPAPPSPALVAEVVPASSASRSASAPRDLHVYLVAGERPLLGRYRSRPPRPSRPSCPALAGSASLLPELGHILITHPDVDHFGGNGAMKRAAPQARLVAHALDRR